MEWTERISKLERTAFSGLDAYYKHITNIFFS